MSDVVIQVENLSKKYIIRHANGAASGNGLRHVINDVVAAPFKRLRQQRAMLPDQSHGSVGSVPNSFTASEDFWALRDVCFEVKRGEVLGIIGRNGAGKSTLLKILSRITEPTSGRIGIKGRVASLLEVGTGFHPELTGRENVFLNGAILGMTQSEIRKKFDEIIAFAEIEQFLDTPVKRYSSGMYVRLAFAVAAHLEPEILIVDEVLAVGDVSFQKKCLGKMREVSTEQGRTVIFVSHQMAAVRRLCTGAYILDKGRCEGPYAVELAIQKYCQQFRNSPWSIDLRNVPRAGGMGETARILALRVRNPPALCYGERAEFIFTVCCEKAIDGAAIGFAFDTQDGNRILTLDSDNSGTRLHLPKGVADVHISLDRLPLHPGSYNCGVALFIGLTPLDTLPYCATWEAQSGGGEVVSDRGFGGCRLPVIAEVRLHCQRLPEVAE